MNSLVLVGFGQFKTACCLPGAMDIHSAFINFPKNYISLWNNSHFLGFNFRLYSLILSKTLRKCCKAQSKSFPRTMISSIYTNTCVQTIPLSTNCIALWNVAGALQSTIPILVCSNNPYLVMNAVFFYLCQPF